MNANVIETGSQGNCVILEEILALDMGVSWHKICGYRKALQVVFVSHWHGDHFRETTIRNLARYRPQLRFCGGKFMVPKFYAAGVNPRNIDVLELGKVSDYGAFQIEPVELFHDVPNYGCKITMNGEKACYFVDTGSLDGITAKDYDLYLVEANHTRADIEKRAAEKMAAGLYSYEKRAAEYHLSFEQTTDWLIENMGKKGFWIPLHQHIERGEKNAEQIPEGIDLHQ